MSEPTINRRLQPGFIIVTTDEGAARDLKEVAGEDWQVEVVPSIEEAGEWNEILLYRFILLDLAQSAADPVEQLQRIRREYMINTPVLGFGGTKEVWDRVRPEGVDRLFEREEIVGKLPEFMAALGW
ncbi:hypothetical protein [Thiohalorhabdus methylotrophus]|uniref:Response regulatory domain-containing protein n=1 Tax=Thiohalorhabdus methylotrophus TaxID=3242694 RepID=A0ABV4TUW3_9GAMM